MKARLWRGPFDGKVMNVSPYQSIIIRRGPKPMSRRQRYEYEIEYFRDHNVFNGPGIRYPQVEAEYRIVYIDGVPSRHPDGSYFYKWENTRSLGV